MRNDKFFGIEKGDTIYVERDGHIEEWCAGMVMPEKNPEEKNGIVMYIVLCFWSGSSNGPWKISLTSEDAFKNQIKLDGCVITTYDPRAHIERVTQMENRISYLTRATELMEKAIADSKFIISQEESEGIQRFLDGCGGDKSVVKYTFTTTEEGTVGSVECGGKGHVFRTIECHEG